MTALANHWSTVLEPSADFAMDPLLATLRVIARQQRLTHGGPLADHPLALLLQHLHHSFGRAPRMHSYGVSERTFDESWLLAVFRARLRQDVDSYHFLLRSRLKSTAASEAHFLIGQAHLTLDMFG